MNIRYPITRIERRCECTNHTALERGLTDRGMPILNLPIHLQDEEQGAALPIAFPCSPIALTVTPGEGVNQGSE